MVEAASRSAGQVHALMLDYARARWPIPTDDSKAISHIKNNFFGAIGILSAQNHREGFTVVLEEIDRRVGAAFRSCDDR